MISSNRTLRLLILLSLFSSCKEKMTEDEIANIGIAPCRKPAPFLKQLGIDPSRSAFSTENVEMKGIVLLQAPQNQSDTIKKYQDPTWAQFGYMGGITTDDKGNAYTFPIPFINTLDNPLSKIHNIYKIDNATGKMNLFTTLPKIDSTEGVVAYGLLGLYYDCHGSKLYASSVGGSTRDDEKGIIYVIEATSGKILDEFKGIDAMGLCVGGITGKKLLYFGKARTPDIYTIELDKEGLFNGKPELALSLDQLGPRGDDKARRIRFDKTGYLLVHGIEFNFSLAGQSEKPETQYLFGYNIFENKWNLMESK